MPSSAVIASWVGTGLLALTLVFSVHRVPRTRGREILFHVLFISFAAAAVLFLPEGFSHDLFSPIGVAIVGTVLPIYESVRAVCTPGGEDDKSWLQYWITTAPVVYATEWVDDVAEKSEAFRRRWYEFELFLFLWLLLPQTDGAAVIFEFFTEPVVAPVVQPWAKKINTWVSNVVATVISASHLWVIWSVFVFLDPGLKRFVTVTVGVVYPVMASIVAAASEGYDDDTYWLTYWSCYECLFLIMEGVETWLGRVPGFYSAVLLSSVYLMLPIFRGAEKLFRNILAPLAGLNEMLLLRDALAVKHKMTMQLPADRARDIKQIVAASFAQDGADGKEDEPLLQYAKNYHSLDLGAL